MFILKVLKKNHKCYWQIKIKYTFAHAWRDGRVVDCGGLENRCTERYRGFESLSLRNYGCSSVGRALVSKTRCRAFESLLPCIFCIIMKKIINYFRESFDELVNKVSWPSRSELQNSAMVVMIATLIIAIIVFCMDITFQTLTGIIYKMFF